MLQLLFDGSGARLYVRDLQRRSGLALGTVRQELQQLVELDLVQAETDGNRVYYQANRAHPIYPDLCQIVMKTGGLTDMFRQVLQDKAIRTAFIFGSVGRAGEQAHSDVDLMVIGAVSLRQLSKWLSGVSGKIGREVNPHILTPEEFARRKKAKDHFLVSVLATPRLFIVGNEDELEAMGG